MSRLKLFITSLALAFSGGLTGTLIIPWLGATTSPWYSLLLLVCMGFYLGGFVGMFWAVAGPLGEEGQEEQGEAHVQ